MRSEFSEHYKTLPKNELFEVVLEKERYKKEAIEAAIKEINRRNLDGEIAKILVRKVQKNKSSIEEDEFCDNYDHNNQEWHYQLIIHSESPDVPKFEKRLHDGNITYSKNESKEDGLILYRYTFNKDIFSEAEEILEDIYAGKSELGSSDDHIKESAWSIFVYTLFIAAVLGTILVILFDMFD